MTTRRTSPHRPGQPANRAALLLLPLAALLATLPLIHQGSCGQDLGFHLQSWLDAAQQLRHGHYPNWAFSPAFQAGEPRFVFYPPLSWLLGALLTLVFPIAACPVLYVWIALTAAGFAMYRLARQFAPPEPAFLAACLYLVSPYLMLNAVYRSADAELLAAAWVPLLFLAILRTQPRTYGKAVRGIALPLALLWLTNAPSAVMGSYTLALLALLRVAAAWFRSRRAPAPTRAPASPADSPTRLALVYASGAALGLALPAFYLVPAAWEQRFVQVAMAIIPNMRYQDNFLFHHTGDVPHDSFNHITSLLAVTLLAATAAALAGVFLSRHLRPLGASGGRLEASTDYPAASPDATPDRPAPPRIPLMLLALFVAITFMLLPISAPVWHYLPELKFLQFPWRLLTILSSVLGLALALLFERLRPPRHAVYPIAAAAVLALAFIATQRDRQECDPPNFARFVQSLFRSSHGVPATDEYTPTNADNDTLRSDDPGFWLSPDPQAFAPATFPNPNATNPDFEGDIPLSETTSARAPLHLTLNLPHPEALILNLRDFPDWRLTETTPGRPPTHPPHIPRDDGLLAIALPAGLSTLAVTWRHTLDQTLGDALSLCALLALALTFRRHPQQP